MEHVLAGGFGVSQSRFIGLLPELGSVGKVE